MEGLLRSLLFGGAWSLAPIPIALLLWPDFFPATTTQAWIVGVCAALASAMAIWMAARLSATSSWLIAIVGWIVGFNLAPSIIGILLQIIR